MTWVDDTQSGEQKLRLRDDGATAFRPDDHLGRYLVIRFIARGGMGEVYEAEDLELSCRVVLKTLRREILENNRRNDGRRFDEIRNITSEVGVLPRTHGSALFTRGETQALVTVTLGTSEDMQIIDTVQEPDHKKRFMLHYNFPPFSVGEVKFLRGPGRREIGHGALAERSLREALPDEESFPYTVRIVSDILESNGSSSMASICGGTLALATRRPLKARGGRGWARQGG